MQFQKVKDSSEIPPDEYLSSTELMTLQHVLVDRANALLEASRTTVSALTTDRQADPDHLDQASNESDRDFSLRLAGRERHMLGKITKALQSIQEGEYATCESCGENITFKRLMVRPVARLCIDCKTQAEQLERGDRGY